MKPLKFLGNSYEDLCDFPREVQRLAGTELMLVQLGRMPTDLKPMPTVGSGAYEIRVRHEGAWRVIYVAKFAEAVYVLHAFQKKTQQTAKEDIDTAKRNYKRIEA
jgi:phage-related protein